jgi:hypothetical protein
MTEFVADISIPVSGLHEALTGLKNPVNIVRIRHLEASGVDSNILHLARRDQHAKDIVVTLATLGYYSFMAAQGVTSFVFDGHIGKLWHSVKEGAFLRDENGLVYTYTKPTLEVNHPKLLVVFSSIGPDITSPRLVRYFTQNYQSVQKFVPGDTAILRIADIGGVQGAFYLNTTFQPANADNIAGLISRVRAKHGIRKESVVLYGASKGATGALYHGLTSGYRAVAVDPIVSDEYYEKRYNDTHFTQGGIFPKKKQDVFREVVDQYLGEAGVRSESAHLSVITSSRSPQFAYVQSLISGALLNHLAVFNTLNPRINDHPDVSPNSLDLALTLINTFFYDIGLSPGFRDISFE